MLFILFIGFQIASARIFGIKQIDTNQSWSFHLDAVVFPISQVLAGKTLLVDLPAQYGLFAEMIAPILKLMGPSVLSITQFFGVLQITSLLCLFYVLSKIINNIFLLFVGSFALIMVTYWSFAIIGNFFPDPYFQYYPIRFIFPAISIFCFYNFCNSRKLFNSFIFSIISGLALLWNIDTGLVVFLSFTAFLLSRMYVNAICKHRTKLNFSFYLKAFVLHVTTTAFICCLFFLYLSLKSGRSLNYYWLIEYQKIFYNVGFYMLPMPTTLHPWMSVLAICFLAVIAAYVRFFRTEWDIKSDLLFYVGILGIGLFSYYQGRSHDFVLSTVVWVPIFILVIFSDDLLREIRNKGITAPNLVLGLTTSFTLIILSLTLISHSKLLVSKSLNVYRTWDQTKSSVIESELTFIKTHASQDSSCVILSLRQGIYYLELGMGSGIKGPGFIETILQTDVDKTVSKVMSGEIMCLFFGIGDSYNPGSRWNIETASLLAKYDISAVNAEKTLLFLTPKPSLPLVTK